MLQASTIKFLRDLKKNNNKPWFEKNKDVYLNAREDIGNLAEQVIEKLGRTDTDIAPLQAKDCLYRIYRDVRFSKDKTPYKNNIGAFMNKGGKKAPTAGYYFQCAPGRNIAGGGLWMPPAPDLNKVRQEIDYNFDEWRKIVEGKSFKKLFPQGLEQEDLLSRPPKGYDADHPAIEYLKLKSFVVIRHFTDEEMQSKTLAKEIVKTFETMHPFIQFLNRSLE